MDSDNYSEQNQKVQKKKEFNFKQIEPECPLKPVVSSILIECAKSKPFFPQILLRKMCQESGLECSQDTFFNLMSNLADFALADLISVVKETKEMSKYKKDGVLQSEEVQNGLEQREVFLSQPKIITEMAINEIKEAMMVEQQHS